MSLRDNPIDCGCPVKIPLLQRMGQELAQMYGPAVHRERVSSIRRLFGLASMYPATMDISARAVLLADSLPLISGAGRRGGQAWPSR
jgi:hypothetical protein